MSKRAFSLPDKGSPKLDTWQPIVHSASIAATALIRLAIAGFVEFLCMVDENQEASHRKQPFGTPVASVE